MEDKLIMTNLLDTNKSICNLVNQGVIESNDDEICNAYKTTLQVLLTMQHDLYKTMQEEGWYPVEDVKQPAINKVKTKFVNKN
jgi:spore coat protein CotF